MRTPLTAHRRRFVRTTILAICVVILFLISMATCAVLFGSSVADGDVAWGVVAIVSATLVLTLLSAYAALIAVGGMIVLYRDSREERGLPYFPPDRVNGSSVR